MHKHRNICKLYIYLSMLTGLLLQEKIYKLFLGFGLGLRGKIKILGTASSNSETLFE